MNDFEKEFLYGTMSIAFFWIDELKEYVTEIMTPWGLCITYNAAFNHDLMNQNLTSSDLHYQSTRKMVADQRIYKFETEPKEMPQKISTSKAGLWVGFNLLRENMKKLARNQFEGYTMIFHDSHELPSANSKVLNLNLRFHSTILIDPRLNSIDESLYGYEPAE